MTLMNPVIESHRKRLKELAGSYGIRSIKVFGSMARGDEKPESDVDLLVEIGPEVSGFTLGALLMDAQDLLGRPVDIVTLAALHPAIREQVLREAQEL
jgi:predicted nucleotidyltransferase